MRKGTRCGYAIIIDNVKNWTGESLTDNTQKTNDRKVWLGRLTPRLKCKVKIMKTIDWECMT